MNIIYSIIMLALVGLALTAQTAFATNGNESKGNATGYLTGYQWTPTYVIRLSMD
jgi:hypothetical protein